MPKEREKLEGLEFNNWLVLEYIDRGDYRCVCKLCGAERDISGYFLKNGKFPKCTCMSGRVSSGGVQDLKGKKFGTWTALEYVGNYTWKCQCECGAVKNIKSRYLNSGEHLTCKVCSGKSFREDLTGKTFGEWTVLGYDYSAKMWLCRCSCGKEQLIRTQSLNSGASKSCGHATTGLRDLTGQQFGDWTVLKYVGNSRWLCRSLQGEEREIDGHNLRRGMIPKGEENIRAFKDIKGETFGEWTALEYNSEKHMWRCRCTCGNEGYISHYALVNGESKSCGHDTSAFKDITGQQFGEWTALEYDKDIGKWLCMCSCGAFRYVTGWALRSGESKSCGCKAIELRDKNNFEKYGTRVPNQVVRNRSPEQIKMISSKEEMVKLITSFDHLPKTYELAEKTGSTQTGILWMLRNYGLEELVDVGKSNVSGMENQLNSLFNCSNKRDRTVLNGKEIDMYFPDKHLGIEVNGTYYHSEIKKPRKYHQEKSLLALDKGVNLIHIYEYEWKNDDTRRKLVSLLERKLKPENNRIIYARDCKVVLLDATTASDFLDMYHLQGKVNSSVNLGIQFNDELVGVMTFGSPRFSRDEQFELLRLAWKDKAIVVGGAPKMFKYFVDNYNPSSIITYCDIGKFSGDVYEHMGFKDAGLTDPNYVWVDGSSSKVCPRYKTMKHKLVEAGLGTEDESESEIMLRLGYIRVYDSGNRRYIWNSDNN